MNTDHTICALATPAGIGAIGVIRLSGKDAIAIAASVFRGKNLLTVDSHTVHYGLIMDQQHEVDEVMVTVFRSPRSFTTEDVVEISCHGSPFVAEQIVRLLLKNGATAAQPGEFTLRAFMNGRIDLTQAEAVADLIASNSATTHDVALRQMRGGFASDLKNLRQQLIDYAALLELELDFGEEDVEFANRENLIGLIELISQKIQSLLNSFRFGNVIKHGVNTVIAGKPNAGKSTLLNALLNEERAIVSDIPGTTRDTIEEVISIHGLRFRFIDTAGLRDTTDVIEKMGVEKSYNMIRRAAVLLYLFDAGKVQNQQEVLEELAAVSVFGIPCLAIANKSDLLTASLRQQLQEIQGLLLVSAKNKTGIEELRQQLYEVAVGREANDPSAEIVTNIRHYDALGKAHDALGKAKAGLQNGLSGELVAFDLREALTQLGSITGEVSNEEVLDSIFSRFCIGK